MSADPNSPRLVVANLPQHVAVIMDGNGRWAVRHLPRVEGIAGAESVRAIGGPRGTGDQVSTLYAFSVENWNRPKDEVNNVDEVPRRATSRTRRRNSIEAM